MVPAVVLVQTSWPVIGWDNDGNACSPADRGSVKGLHFDHEVVILCVRWYVTYKLSSRDLVSMMGERGIELAVGPRYIGRSI